MLALLALIQAPYKAQLEPMLLRYVVPAFGAPVGHLRAKACWVTQQYADMRFVGGRGRGATFLQLFQSTLGLLADPELPVRFVPCTCSSLDPLPCARVHCWTTCTFRLLADPELPMLFTTCTL